MFSPMAARFRTLLLLPLCFFYFGCGKSKPLSVSDDLPLDSSPISAGGTTTTFGSTLTCLATARLLSGAQGTPNALLQVDTLSVSISGGVAPYRIIFKEGFVQSNGATYTYAPPFSLSTGAAGTVPLQVRDGGSATGSCSLSLTGSGGMGGSSLVIVPLPLLPLPPTPTPTPTPTATPAPVAITAFTALFNDSGEGTHNLGGHRCPAGSTPTAVYVDMGAPGPAGHIWTCGVTSTVQLRPAPSNVSVLVATYWTPPGMHTAGGAACAPGYVSSGTNGDWGGGFGYGSQRLCSLFKPAAELNNGDYYVTGITTVGNGQHGSPSCPAGWEHMNGVTDTENGVIYGNVAYCVRRAKVELGVQ